jgi:hypothetical protein
MELWMVWKLIKAEELFLNRMAFATERIVMKM